MERKKYSSICSCIHQKHLIILRICFPRLQIKHSILRIIVSSPKIIVNFKRYIPLAEVWFTTNMNNTTQYKFNVPILVMVLQIPSSFFKTEIWIREMESCRFDLFIFILFDDFMFKNNISDHIQRCEMWKGSRWDVKI